MNEVQDCNTDGIEMPSWHLCEEAVIHLTPREKGRERERKQVRRESAPLRT
jgi:hypothetical protein